MDYFTPLLNAVSSCFSWLQSVLTSSGMYSYILGGIVFLIFWRLVVKPLFGGSSRTRGSDSVKKQDQSEEG